MHWLIQSCLGLRWALPYVLATCAGGRDCEPGWIHDPREAVWVPADSESRGYWMADEDYYATPAVICLSGAAVICTIRGCTK